MNKLSFLYRYPLLVTGLALIGLGVFAHFIWAPVFTPALVLVGIIFAARQGIVSRFPSQLLTGLSLIALAALLLYLGLNLLAGFFLAMGAVALVTYRRG